MSCYITADLVCLYFYFLNHLLLYSCVTLNVDYFNYSLFGQRSECKVFIASRTFVRAADGFLCSLNELTYFID